MIGFRGEGGGVAVGHLFVVLLVEYQSHDNVESVLWCDLYFCFYFPIFVLKMFRKCFSSKRMIYLTA